MTVFPYPVREDILLEQGGTYRIVLNNRDLKVRYDDDAQYFPQFPDCPIKSRQEWERYKVRIKGEVRGALR